MKFRITLKDPDGVYDSIQDAAEEMAKQVTGIDEDEREDIIEIKREKLKELVDEWIEYMEYLTVEVDTEMKTISVVPIGK